MPAETPTDTPLAVVRASAHITTSWLGGVTTELAIFPTSSSFQARDFVCRLSTATVEQSGPFTVLPGYKRSLYLLEGDGMELQVQNPTESTTVRLTTPMQHVAFDGNATVTATLLGGTVRDFNIIHQPSMPIHVQAMVLNRPTHEIFCPPQPRDQRIYRLLLICVRGRVSLNYREHQIDLDTFDVLTPRLPAGTPSTLQVHANAPDAAVLAITVGLAKDNA